MARILHIDFYSVIPPEGESFGALLKKVRSKRKSVITVDQKHVGFLQGSKNGSIWEFDMLRIKMESLPEKARVNGVVESLGLANDEGIGERTAFLYDEETHVLVAQRHRVGVSTKLLARYVQHLLKLDDPIDFLPVIEQGALQRLNELEEITRFEISLARIDKSEAFVDGGGPLAGAIQSINTLDAPTAKIICSVGRERKRSLLTSPVKKIAEIFVQAGNANVRKLEVVGLRNEEERDVIDLMNYCLTEQCAVEPGPDRTISYVTRQKPIRDAWERQKDQLQSKFGE